MATLFEYHDPSTNLDVSEADNQDWYGQWFTIGSVGANEEHTLESAEFKIYRQNSPGTITCVLTAVDGSNKPTGADLSTGTIDGDTINTSPAQWQSFTMSSYTMAASTKYALFLKCLNGDNSNKIWITRQHTTPGYANGDSILTSNAGSSWTVDTGNDTAFKEYGADAVPAMQVNIGDAWKAAASVQINFGDAWKAGAVQFQKGDAWKAV